jgi:putative DNA primase/helicase
MSVKDELQKAGVYTLPPVAPEQPESVLIIQRLETLGYKFRLNLCTDTIEVNERPLSDITAAKIRMQLRDIGLGKKIKAAEDAYAAEAEKNAYHPVHDYLNSLQWNREDHIAELTGWLESDDPPVVYRDSSTHPLHGVYLYRWLIGAVAKALDGKQNPMLVLDGPQGIGKSTLAKWLCSGLPGYFIEGPINVADKDSDVRLISRWIWEVSELDATTRKADVSAIKAFITKEIVSVRKAYGRFDIIKPALASLIGTVNNTSGFLADESGSRRFLITRLTKIDRRYMQMDVNQIWAQAVALYREGEQWMLIGEEAQAQRTTNEKYEVETILDDWIEKYFVFDSGATEPVSLADIISALAHDDIRLSGSERMQAAELARTLTRHGAQRVHTHNGKRWIGLFKVA